MQIVRNFCLYCRRSSEQIFIPSILTFPIEQHRKSRYIFSNNQIAQLINAAKSLPPSSQNPLRADVIRLAIILLYTCGLRHGELRRLTIGNFNPAEATLFIKDTKFNKSRIIPLSSSTERELRAYFTLRRSMGLPMKETSPLICSKSGTPQGKAYSGFGLKRNWDLLCVSLNILTAKGIPPRIHDARHSFAVNKLLQWYEQSEDVQAKLPYLSMYMGHTNIASTQYYLALIEPIRSAANARFEKNFGNIIKKNKKTALTNSEVFYENK